MECCAQSYVIASSIRELLKLSVIKTVSILSQLLPTTSNTMVLYREPTGHFTNTSIAYVPETDANLQVIPSKKQSSPIISTRAVASSPLYISYTGIPTYLGYQSHR